jgi:uncharacterized protein (DUF433 family)
MDKELPPGQSFWKERIIFDSAVLEGKPVIKETHVTVDSVISLLARGLTESDILRAHPELTAEDIQACLAYSQDKRFQAFRRTLID